MVDESAVRAFISASSWFDGAPYQVIDKLAVESKLEVYPAGSYLWSQGETNTEIFGIVSGRVRVCISGPAGQEFALVDREKGSWLGEACLKDDLGRVIGARTLVPCTVVIIRRKTLLEVAEDWPSFYRNLFFHSSDISRGLYETLSGILFLPLKKRVAERLLVLAQEHGQQVEEGTLLDIKVSQNDFARLAKGSRQRVNRIFRDWEKRGLVGTRGDLLLIRNMELFEREEI